MTERELQLYKALSEDSQKLIIELLSYTSVYKNKGLGLWRAITTLTAAFFMFSIDFETLGEYASEYGDFITPIWDPMLEQSSDSLYDFWSNDGVKKLWRENMPSGVDVPHFDALLFDEDGWASTAWESTVLENILDKYTDMQFLVLLFMVIHRINGGNCNMFQINPYLEGYKTLNLMDDIVANKLKDSVISLVKRREHVVAISKYLFDFKSLIDLCPRFTIIGRIPEEQYLLDEGIATTEKYKCPLRMATFYDEAEYQEYYDKAQQFLSGIDGLFKDDVVNILKSHFERFKPREAYKIITGLF